VARVAAVIPDLLFGSRVQSALEAAGHEVELLPREPAGPEEVAGAGVLVVDLTSPDLDGAALVERLAADGALTGMKVLGFFAHVEPAVRDRALAAGFDQVVPRSRMNREGAELVGRLAARGTR
jgi:CheY-like chemotaxis protein